MVRNGKERKGGEKWDIRKEGKEKKRNWIWRRRYREGRMCLCKIFEQVMLLASAPLYLFVALIFSVNPPLIIPLKL